MAVHIQKNLLVDRIRMVRAIQDTALCGIFIDKMKFLKEEKPIAEGHWRLRKHAFVTRASFCGPGKRKVLDLTVGSTKSKALYFAIDLHAGILRPAELGPLVQVLDALFDQFGYTAMFKEGRVTKLELATDTLSQQMHTFIPVRKNCTKSLIWSDGGEKGSIYLGSAQSDLRFCIYDKKRQLEEVKMKVVSHAVWTRIEARLYDLTIPAADLVKSTPNPFAGLQVADLVLARQQSTTAGWKAFIERCLDQGSCAALAAESRYYRSKYRSLLAASKAWWWNPGAVWSRFPDAIGAISPSH